jgi:xanthine dehydrogenase accessory factor
MSTWLEPMSGEWVGNACDLLAQHPAVVRITVAQLRGSAPREAGASLLVAPARVLGSIGGGQLEWHALQAAQALLRDATLPPIRLFDLTLGPDLNQCCGGRVQLWAERLTHADLPGLQGARTLLQEQGAVSIVTHVNGGRVTRQFALPEAAALSALRVQSRADGSLTLVEGWRRRLPALWIFGAGHVGQAIVRLLAALPLFEVTWVESRAGMLPDSPAAALPAHLHPLAHPAPVDCIAQLAPGARVLVLTHDHALDYALCRAVLARDDFTWLGLIGSHSKRARFRSRLAREGVASARIERLCCPIGMAGIHSKLPAAIAVSAVAQLLEQLGVQAAQRLPPAAAQSGTGCDGDCADCGESRRLAR